MLLVNATLGWPGSIIYDDHDAAHPAQGTSRSLRASCERLLPKPAFDALAAVLAIAGTARPLCVVVPGAVAHRASCSASGRVHKRVAAGLEPVCEHAPRVVQPSNGHVERTEPKRSPACSSRVSIRDARSSNVTGNTGGAICCASTSWRDVRSPGGPQIRTRVVGR